MTGPIKRGLLWQQRDRLFSRWKERYFVLTRDYLHCFKRASGSANDRISDMGQFIFKVSYSTLFSHIAPAQYNVLLKTFSDPLILTHDLFFNK